MTVIGGKYSVLLVDDDEDYRKYIRILLREYRLNITEAIDGADGLAKHNECKPALIITDIQMPVVDGYEFISSVREGDNQTPVIAISSEQSFLEKALVCGANESLEKSFSKEDFVECIQKYLTI